MWCETRKSGLGIIWIRIRISTDTDCYRETTLSVACFSAWWLRMKKKYLTLKRWTLGSTRKVIPPSWCKCREWRGGGVVLMELLSRVVAVFQNKFAFGGKPLFFSTRWGIFYGWWRCWGSVTSPNMVAILDFSRITTQVKKGRINNFLRLTCKITHN